MLGLPIPHSPEASARGFSRACFRELLGLGLLGGMGRPCFHRDADIDFLGDGRKVGSRSRKMNTS